MRTVLVLIIKFILVTAVLYIVNDLFYGWSLTVIVITSTVVTLISFFLGDLYILPATNNTFATISDFVMNFLTIWIMGHALIDEPISIVQESFISTVIITAAEFLLHRYLVNNVFGGVPRTRKESPV
ncbi:MAG: DUF2512 family protein [Tuberibacillus sp.]